MNLQSRTPGTQPDDSPRGLNSPWFRRHATIAPFGVFIFTWLMCWSETGNWRCLFDWSETSSLVDYGIIIYGMIAVVFEKGLDVMFWALEQRKKRIARYRAEMMAEGLAEGRAQGRSEMLADLLANAHHREDGESISDWLERMGRDLENGAKT